MGDDRTRSLSLQSLREDSGATIALIAFMMTVLLGSGSVALDLMAQARSGQHLQTAADAAALVAASALETGDPGQVHAAVDAILAQNNIAPDTDVVVSYPTSRQVTIKLTDMSPTSFLPMGRVLDPIVRQATAEHRYCEVRCSQLYSIPAPLMAIETNTDGDGFLPIAVGNRLYAINHNDNAVTCVDRSSNQRCWPERPAFAQDDVKTKRILHTHLIGRRIYFLGSTAVGRLHLSCFDTITDIACPTSLDLGAHGPGTLAGIGHELHVLTATRKIFCFDPSLGLSPTLESIDTCQGYQPTGLDTALAAVPSWNINIVDIRQSDRVIHEGRIYQSIAHGSDVWISCWDTDLDVPCSSFGGPREIDYGRSRNSDTLSQLRLFFGRNNFGTPTSVCSFGSMSVSCLRLDDGEHDWATNAALDQAHSLMNDGLRVTGSWAQTASYHEPTNRLFLSAASVNETYCYDFNVGQPCGFSVNTTSLGNPHVYGYISGGDECLIGLGHTSIFFSLHTDMNGPCTETTSTFVVRPCNCLGDGFWPAVAAGNVDDLAYLKVQILSPSGAVIPMPHGDAKGFVDLLKSPLDMSTIASHPRLQISVHAAARRGVSAWGNGADPLLILDRPQPRPHLVD